MLCVQNKWEQKIMFCRQKEVTDGWRLITSVWQAVLCFCGGSNLRSRNTLFCQSSFSVLTPALLALYPAVGLCVSKFFSAYICTWIIGKLWSVYKAAGLIPHFINWMHTLYCKREKKISLLLFFLLLLFSEDFKRLYKKYLECYAPFCFTVIAFF